MTTEEKRDLLILANSALRTAVILIEQAVGSKAALDIVSMPVLNAVSATTKEIAELEGEI